MKTNFEIIPFDKKFIRFFIDLNTEWLESFFEVENYDREVLKNCEELIINSGGYIFFGKKNNIIIGTFAFIKRNNNLFELSKMAIKKEERGKGYGSKMLEFAILFGEKHNWKETYLYSSTKLKNSIYLYKKYGFKKNKNWK
jgi:GNAT superfamily N-acetyltransferase